MSRLQVNAAKTDYTTKITTRSLSAPTATRTINHALPELVTLSTADTTRVTTTATVTSVTSTSSTTVTVPNQRDTLLQPTDMPHQFTDTQPHPLIPLDNTVSLIRRTLHCTVVTVDITISNYTR